MFYKEILDWLLNLRCGISLIVVMCIGNDLRVIVNFKIF